MLVGIYQGDGVRGLLPQLDGASADELCAVRHLRMAGAGVSRAAAMAFRSGYRADGGERERRVRAPASARYLFLLVRARDGVDDRACIAASLDDVRVRLFDRAAVGDE